MTRAVATVAAIASLASLASLAALAGCKDKPHDKRQNQRPDTDRSAGASHAGSEAGSAAARAAGAPAGSGAAPREPEGLQLPAITGARELAPARATPDGDALMTTWCFADTTTDDAVKQIEASLTATGFLHVASRGSGARRAISGTRGEHRISVVLGGVDRGCTGVVASATIVELGRFAPPPIEPGEKLR